MLPADKHLGMIYPVAVAGQQSVCSRQLLGVSGSSIRQSRLSQCDGNCFM